MTSSLLHSYNLQTRNQTIMEVTPPVLGNNVADYIGCQVSLVLLSLLSFREQTPLNIADGTAFFTIGIPFPMTTSRTGYLVLAFWNRGIANSYSKWRVFGQYGYRKKPQGLDPRSEVFCGLRCLRQSSLLRGKVFVNVRY